jgi:hypothetical protein
LHRLLCQAFKAVMIGARGAEVMRAMHGRFRPLRYGRLILTILLSWLMLIAGMAGRGAAASTLKVSPQSYDFGEVKRLGGQVHTTFMVYNQGNAPIHIRRIWTS